MLSRTGLPRSLCVDCALLRHNRIVRWRGRTVRLATVTSAALDAPSPEAWLRGSVLLSAVSECLTSSRGGLDRALKLLVSSNDGADRIDVETGSQLLTLLCRERELQLRDVELVLSRLDGASCAASLPLSESLTAPFRFGAGLNVTPAAARLVLRVFLAAEQTERAVTLFREFQAAGVEFMPSTYTDLIACVYVCLSALSTVELTRCLVPPPLQSTCAQTRYVSPERQRHSRQRRAGAVGGNSWKQ